MIVAKCGRGKKRFLGGSIQQQKKRFGQNGKGERILQEDRRYLKNAKLIGICKKSFTRFNSVNGRSKELELHQKKRRGRQTDEYA